MREAESVESQPFGDSRNTLAQFSMIYEVRLATSSAHFVCLTKCSQKRR